MTTGYYEIELFGGSIDILKYIDRFYVNLIREITQKDHIILVEAEKTDETGRITEISIMITDRKKAIVLDRIDIKNSTPKEVLQEIKRITKSKLRWEYWDYLRFKTFFIEIMECDNE